MKRFKNVFVLLILGAIAAMTLAGCKKREPADAYIKAELEKVQKGEYEKLDEMLNEVLEEDLDTNGVEDFPEELKEEYLTFLKEACGHIKYSVNEEKKQQNEYKVTVEIEPLDIRLTTTDPVNEYMNTAKAENLTEEMHEILKLSTEALASPVYSDKLTASFRLSYKDGTYTQKEDELLTAVKVMLVNASAPYVQADGSVNMKAYVKSCQDAMFKGDYTEYARQTGMTDEEAQKEIDEMYEQALPNDVDLTDEQETRYLTALKKIMANTIYEVGNIQQVDSSSYTAVINYTPNLALQKCFEDLLSNAESGKYSSEAQLIEGLLTLMEQHAETPVNGEPSQMTVNIIRNSSWEMQIDDSDSEELFMAMLPTQ
ncbi:hypothetical protein ABXS75_11750 [Roseburia hominis]